jgi:hypothetical protein
MHREVFIASIVGMDRLVYTAYITSYVDISIYAHNTD